MVHTRLLEAEMVPLPADMKIPGSPPQPDSADLVPGAAAVAGDAMVTKRQWRASYGADLKLQLRRRQINTLIIAGVATEVGVESTVREAFDRGYGLIFIEDAISGATEGANDLFLTRFFTRIGHVRSSAEVATALSGG